MFTLFLKHKLDMIFNKGSFTMYYYVITKGEGVLLLKFIKNTDLEFSKFDIFTSEA